VEELEFDALQGQEIFISLLERVETYTPSYTRGNGDLSEGAKLTTQLHLEPNNGFLDPYLHSPTRLHGAVFH
jgi:hypothetical protein